MTSRAVKERPQRLPEGPAISIMFMRPWRRNLLFEPACDIDGLRSLPHSFAVGRHFLTLPVIGLHVRLHQPPARETCPLAPLLEHDDITVRPEVLVGIEKLDCSETATPPCFHIRKLISQLNTACPTDQNR